MPPKILFLILTLLFLPAQIQAGQPDAPFGLKWGMTQKQIKALGVELNALEEGIYSSKSLPRNMEWADTYVLMIDPGLGLTRIAAYTGNILNDPHGQQGRRIYFKLKGELQKNMVLIYSEEKNAGTPGVTPPPGQSFYTCLGEGPCGAWYSNFVKEKINAQIILEALDANAGFASVIYEHSGLVQKLKNRRPAAKP